MQLFFDIFFYLKCTGPVEYALVVAHVAVWNLKAPCLQFSFVLAGFSVIKLRLGMSQSISRCFYSVVIIFNKFDVSDVVHNAVSCMSGASLRLVDYK